MDVKQIFGKQDLRLTKESHDEILEARSPAK
jgi:hypothetical protein